MESDLTPLGSRPLIHGALAILQGSMVDPTGGTNHVTRVVMDLKTPNVGNCSQHLRQPGKRTGAGANRLTLELFSNIVGDTVAWPNWLHPITQY